MKRKKSQYELRLDEMLKNPKIKEALKGLLAPLEQEGDSLIIKTSEINKKNVLEQKEN